jgi:ribosomal protein S27AE
VKNNGDGLDLFNVCGPEDILKRINLITIDNPLNESTIESIYNTLLYSEADVNDEMHLANIQKTIKERRDYQKELRTAIEKKICPDCGGILSIFSSGLRCNKCGKVIKI